MNFDEYSGCIWVVVRQDIFDLAYKPKYSKDIYIIPEHLINKTHNKVINLRIERLTDKEFRYCIDKNYKVHRLRSLNSIHLKDSPVQVIQRPAGHNKLRALTDYIDKLNIELNVWYEWSEDITIIDNTNRSLYDKLTKGYKGNRLDLMVQRYNVNIGLSDISLGIATKQQGDFYIDTVRVDEELIYQQLFTFLGIILRHTTKNIDIVMMEA
jgi:hypothetical protein